jgi:hypothetical protein
VNDEDWASFLYEDGVYDPKVIDEGLFHGYFLLRVSAEYSRTFLLEFGLKRAAGLAAYIHWSCVGIQEDARPRFQ